MRNNDKTKEDKEKYERMQSTSGSSMGCHPTEGKENINEVMCTVLQKNTRSLSSSERIDEMFSEVQGCKWDAMLVSETWRSCTEEIWEWTQGHIVMGARKYDNKHGAAIIVNKKWKHRINRTNSISERVIAKSITVNKQPITLLSGYMPHSGSADHHVEKAYNMIQRIVRTDKSFPIIGGDFNAEL